MNCPDLKQLMAMVEHSLEPAQLHRIEVHVGDCSHCRQLVAAAFASGSTELGTPPADELEQLASIEGVTIRDRYQVKTMLGRGGMGTVYLATDRTLDREVALKLHRVGSGGDRLHREAIAMAKLAHPNVVTVFEIAAYEDRLYVAMEYVGGGTLRSWLAAKPRSWREVIDLLAHAGTGLAAAHAAGLVHRDFKPENVLVGDDGRPRVSDFGLARSAGRVKGDLDLTRSPSLDVPMTQTGALMGTPMYMAYEQLAGGAVDGRSDQFAFCVVAWECLFGKRPFEGLTIATLAVAIDRQEIVEPATTDVPPRVREIIRRGLAADPEHRHADMPALLAALRAAAVPRSRRRLALAIAGGTLVTGAIVAAVVVSRSSTPAAAVSCAVPDDALADVWDQPLQAKVKDAFARTRPKDGAQIYTRVAKALDEYRGSWLAARRGSCEATATGAQSEALLDLRMSCLDRARDELRALTHGLAEPDDKVVMGSMRAALGLTAIATCADQASLAAPLRPPGQQIHERVEAERSELASARALRLLGKVDAALAKAQSVATHAAELKYRPLEAEALLVVGDLEDRAGDSASAIKLLEQSIVAADAGNHKLVAAEAWSTLAWILGSGERQFDRAQLAVQMASARIESLGGNPNLAAQLANYEGVILETKGQLDAARPRYLAALDTWQRLGDRDSWKLALVLNDLGGLERKQRNFAAARQHHERALAIRRKVFGDSHPYVFSSLNNLGNVAWSQDDHALAEKWFLQAIAVAEDVFPPQHPQTALALANLASAYERQDKLADALATYRRALTMREATRGPDHPEVAETLHEMGNLLATLGKPADARRAYDRALAILESKEAEPELAKVLYDYGDLLAQQKQHTAGEKLLKRSLAIGDKAQPDDPYLGYPLTALGELYTRTHRAADAKQVLERAMILRKPEEVPLDELARTELALANVVWPSDRARALALVQSAKGHVETAKATRHKIYRVIEQWLATHAR